MAREAEIVAARNTPGRVGQATAPQSSPPGHANADTQVTASGSPFWQLGAPQCKGRDVRPYPSTED